ncbi:TIGR03013 family PEP-CTERM/XrtA system glycosyltransferase [Lysobacter ciconiae]|uniref:TIGR03013 family PEP-CTERM/XrtA system glycosyltransferase n=2 Tax=Novilysobacter ciconiae TaxID=2781022 RepID=A0A7S6UEG0_9GAMM|nr:TIGR03013 family PEP-CTERM/XrtA system glycosyltransferase [Lysobacter ciconiae]
MWQRAALATARVNRKPVRGDAVKPQVSSAKSRAALWLWLLESCVLMVVVAAAAWLRFMRDSDSYLFFLGTAPVRILVVAAFITTAMAAFGLYQVHVRHNRTDFVLRLVLSFAFGGVALLVLYYLVPAAYIGRGVLALALALGLMLIFALRLVMQSLGHIETFRRRVLVLGAGRNANLINTRLRRRSDRRSFSLVGFVAVPGQEVVVADAVVLEDVMGLADLARRLQVHEIVVALDERRGGMPMEAMLACVQRGVSMTDLSTFFEREAGVVTMSIADPSWLVFSGGFDHSMPRRLTKRLFDLLAAGALLLVAWPVMLVVMACVWVDSGGPVLYRQTRVGEDGSAFELVKFRSMRADAEQSGVAQWASADDKRSTRVGRFIRMTRLDELPQLFNVLRGDMSFVGPRPERPQFVDRLNQDIRYYNVRHCMKPGLTGWAQLRYPYGASVRDAEEKLKFDLFYVKNHGLLFDLMILLQTVEVVLFRRGAR